MSCCPKLGEESARSLRHGPFFPFSLTLPSLLRRTRSNSESPFSGGGRVLAHGFEAALEELLVKTLDHETRCISAGMLQGTYERAKRRKKKKS